jgi:glucose/arabinose dehydrogenase
MNGPIRLLVAAGLAALAVPLTAQQEVPMRGNTPVAPQGIKAPPLPDTPVRYETGEGQTIKVSVYARGFQNPWSMAFVSDDTILVAERGGAIKAVRNGVVDAGRRRAAGHRRGSVWHGPGAASRLRAQSPGLHQLHQAARPAGRGPAATCPRWRTRWPWRGAAHRGGGGGGGLERQGVHRHAGHLRRRRQQRRPIVFGGDGMLYVARGGGDTQNPNSLAGKILRLTDEGKVPPDNPFVGRADARPEIFTMGHRTFLRMAKHPQTGAIWQIENGPNGGDEVNILTPGSNYGWPLVSLGRTYAGPWQGPLSKEGFKDPLIYWMPAIAVSSITFYTGDRLPKWKGDVFVTGMRYGEIPGTGQLHRILINKNFEELRREALLVDLHRRYRDVKQGRDGLLYLLTDEADAVMLRIEPSE